jgi:cell division protein DivIC
MAKDKKKKKIIWTRFFVFVFILYAIFTIANQQVTIYRMNKTKQEIVENIQTAQKENERLKDMLQYTSTKEYIERMAREQLGLVKSDERVYVDQSLSEGYLQEGGN